MHSAYWEMRENLRGIHMSSPAESLVLAADGHPARQVWHHLKTGSANQLYTSVAPFAVLGSFHSPYGSHYRKVAASGLERECRRHSNEVLRLHRRDSAQGGTRRSRRRWHPHAVPWLLNKLCGKSGKWRGTVAQSGSPNSHPAPPHCVKVREAMCGNRSPDDSCSLQHLPLPR